VECRSGLSSISLGLKGKMKEIKRSIFSNSYFIKTQTTHRKCRRLSNTFASPADMAFRKSHCRL
jgi:hypothetical protein